MKKESADPSSPYWAATCECGSRRTWHGAADSITGAGKCERRYCRCRKDGQNTCPGFRVEAASPLTVARAR